MTTFPTTATGDLDFEEAKKILGDFDVSTLNPQTETSDRGKEKPRPASGDEKNSAVKPAEDDSDIGSDDSRDDSGTDGAGDWRLDDTVLELAESLLLSEDDLAEFDGEDDFRKHVLLLDKKYSRDGQSLLEGANPGDDQEKALQAKEEADRKQEQSDRAKAQKRENGKFADDGEAYEPQLDKDYYDEQIIDEFKRISDRYEQKIADLESRLSWVKEHVSSQVQRDLNERFDRAVDSLGHDELFGKSSSLDRESDEFSNRAKLYQQAAGLVVAMAKEGKAIEIDSPGLLKRALALSFKSKIDQLKRREKAQTNQRRRLGKPMSGRGANDRPATEWSGEPEKNPMLLDYYHRLEKEGA